jgi:hypothetical protein
VESNPCLRKPPSAKAPITFDEIMDALAQLDRLEGSSSRAIGTHWPPRRRTAHAPAQPSSVVALLERLRRGARGARRSAELPRS